MTKLNDLQSILLSSAARREGGSVHPVPESVSGAGARLGKALAALVTRGLAEERGTSDPAEACRTEGNLSYGLYIADAGNAAIGVADAGQGGEGVPSAVVTSEPKPTKTASVLALLQRPDGATLPELIAETGWLPHTTRAALTGLRKKGHVLDKTKRVEATCYRITPLAA